MKKLSQYFLRGLIAILPLGITVYVLYALVIWSETSAMRMLSPVIGQFYIPGLGLIITVVLLICIGFVLSGRVASKLLDWIELPFTNIPVVKSIYSSLKNFADYFSPHHADDTPQQVVVLRMPGQEIEMVGLVTRNHLAGLPNGFTQGDRVAVYLPMGYMIGGYTVFVPRSWTSPIDMTVEEAMRSTLIAWMASRKTPT
jgi:uncharacterized membrane protein